MDELLKKICECKVCEAHLPLGARPIVTGHPQSKIVIIGQAPGSVVHASGIPWDDKSGENLRRWMGVDAPTFYDPSKIALVPMGFCYPGRGKSGDLPPREECAPLWHGPLWENMPEVRLTLLIGTYSQGYYLRGKRKRTLTETVRHFSEYLPKYFVLPHPSPRNNIWQAKNPWFGKEVLPTLQKTLQQCLDE